MKICREEPAQLAPPYIKLVDDAQEALKARGVSFDWTIKVEDGCDSDSKSCRMDGVLFFAFL